MTEERDFVDGFATLKEQEGGPLNVTPMWHLARVAGKRYLHGEQETLFDRPFHSEMFGYSAPSELISSAFLHPHIQRSRGLEEGNGLN